MENHMNIKITDQRKDKECQFSELEIGQFFFRGGSLCQKIGNKDVSNFVYISAGNPAYLEPHQYVTSIESVEIIIK